MRKAAIIIYLCFAVLTLYSQKLITAINTANRVEGYSFKYDRNSGGFVYADYDTTKQKSVIITPKGNSAEYDFEMSYSSVFDGSGNSYTIVYNKVQDTVYKYFLLKNNTEIASYDYISDGWDINNNILYFYIREGNSYYFTAYNTVNSEFSKGKGYDEIQLAYFVDIYYEGEPQGKVGFTKEGKPFYLAAQNDEKFFVIGTEEQKHYSDIDGYSTRLDNNGDLVYFAKSKGKFWVERGNAFLVQGKKEYKAFDYVSGPVLFDKNNTPVYTATDSVKEWDGRSRLMTGDKEGKAYLGYIYDVKITPSGKMAYVVSKPSGENAVNNSFVVIDGKEQKSYTGISNITFTSGDVPVFTASNKNNKYFVVKDDKVISAKYDNIYDYSFMNDGSLAYIGNDFGNYEKQVPDKHYVHILGKKYGPFEFVTMADYKSGKYILVDKNDNFAFVTGKLINPKDYVYKYKVTGNDWESREFDGIDNIMMVNGKVFYIGSEMIDRTNYTYKYKLYNNTKLIAEDYDLIMEPDYNAGTGKITSVARKGNSFYLLEY